MKILLTNSPAYIEDMGRHFSYGRFGCSDPVPYSKGGKNATEKRKIKDHYTPYPWSLGYASALLKRDTNETIKTVDAQAQDFNENDFKEMVRNFKPDVMVVELPTISFGLCMKFLKELKNEYEFKLILTGLHASGLPVETMQEYPFFEYIIWGDYSLPLLEFVKGKKPEEIGNFYYHDGSGNIKKSDLKPILIDFDKMPYPDREDLDVNHYHDFEIVGKPTIHMVTSRGCPFGCSYCNARVFWPKDFYWKRSPKNIVDEMEYVRDKYNARQIYFDDDIMTHDQNRMVELSKEILKRRQKLPFTFMGDINIKEETLKLIVKAGGRGLKFGVESINPKALKDINKAWITKEKVRNFVKMCKKYNLWCHGDFIVGLPQDTKESVEEMLQFALELDLDTAQIYTAQPLPGTPFYYECKQNGWLIAKDWTEYDGNYKSPVSYPWFPKEEIEGLLIKFKREWEYKATINYLKSPKRMIRYIRGRGISYTLKKIKTLIKKHGKSKDHIYVAGS